MRLTDLMYNKGVSVYAPINGRPKLTWALHHFITKLSPCARYLFHSEQRLRKRTTVNLLRILRKGARYLEKWYGK